MNDLTPQEFDTKATDALESGRMVIRLFQDTDGNWRGGLTKKGIVVMVRTVGPETALQELLTHDGK